MTNPSDPVTVYHGPSIQVDWAELDQLSGYNVVRRTPAGDDSGVADTRDGFTVRYLRTDLSDVDTLAAAAGIIAAHLTEQLVLIEETNSAGPIWEAALTAPVPD